jgi:hypothetical protein
MAPSLDEVFSASAVPYRAVATGTPDQQSAQSCTAATPPQPRKCLALSVKSVWHKACNIPLKQTDTLELRILS